MKPIKRLFKNKKGIDTILAALLMVVIVVVASVMVYAWSTGLLGSLLVTPQTGKEALSLENTSFTNGTYTTLFIRNTGTAAVSFVTYYVKDANQNQYSRTSWTGAPTNQAVNGLIQTVININPTSYTAPNTAPGGANNFQFQPGNSYTVVVITSRNNQFTFTIVR
jgi:FlaG/FlaF family flagellin (archaellin)